MLLKCFLSSCFCFWPLSGHIKYQPDLLLWHRSQAMCQLTQLFSVSAPVWSALQEPLNQPAARVDLLIPNGPHSLPCQAQSRSSCPAFRTLGDESGGERSLGTEFNQVRTQASSLWPTQDCREKEYRL